MEKTTPGNLETQGCNIISFLDAAFQKGHGLTKKMIMGLRPVVEPVPPTRIILKQIKGGEWVEGTRVGFTKRSRTLMERFPGYIPDYWQREQLKYRLCPIEHAPIEEWIVQVLNHATAKWSDEVDGGEKRQFVDWLCVYWESPNFRWDLRCANRVKAESLVRVAWGLSRFPLTEPSSKGRRK